MRSLGFAFVLGVTLLLLCFAPSATFAQRGRGMMTSPVRPDMGMSQPSMFSSFSPRPMMTSSSAYQTPAGGSGMGGTPSGNYIPYRIPYGCYDSLSPSSGSSARASQSPRGATADDIEVSGPLPIPPPRRAIVRLRLPRTWIDVGFDGKKVDSMGRERTYVTPELPSARTFEVTATWKHNGRTVWLMEEVTVKAGQIRTLDFTSGN
jgi:uncharacterized protein (TIGR03000 family)